MLTFADASRAFPASHFVTSHPATVLPNYVQKNSDKPLAFGRLKWMDSYCQLTELNFQPDQESECYPHMQVIQNQLTMILRLFKEQDLENLLQECKCFLSQKEGTYYLRMKIWPSQVEGDGLMSDEQVGKFILLLAQSLYLPAHARFRRNLNYYTLYIPYVKLSVLTEKAVEKELYKAWYRSNTSENCIVIPFQFSAADFADAKVIIQPDLEERMADISHRFPETGTEAAILYQSTLLSLFPDVSFATSSAIKADPFLAAEFKQYGAQHSHNYTVITGIDTALFAQFHRATMLTLDQLPTGHTPGLPERARSAPC